MSKNYTVVDLANADTAALLTALTVAYAEIARLEAKLADLRGPFQARMAARFLDIDGPAMNDLLDEAINAATSPCNESSVEVIARVIAEHKAKGGST